MVTKRNRTIKKQFWFNEEERDLLKKKAMDSGMNESEYIRKVVLGYKLKERPDDRFYDVMKTLRNTSNNLNQIATKAHALGFIDELAYKQEVEQLDKFIDDIKKQFLLYGERCDGK